MEKIINPNQMWKVLDNKNAISKFNNGELAVTYCTDPNCYVYAPPAVETS